MPMAAQFWLYSGDFCCIASFWCLCTFAVRYGCFVQKTHKKIEFIYKLKTADGIRKVLRNTDIKRVILMSFEILFRKTGK